MKQENKKRNLFWILIGIGVTIIMLLMILSSILNVGDRLSKINPYVEYAFYVLAFLLVWFLILNPIRIILFAPTFSVATIMDENNKRKKKTYRKVTKNIIKNTDLEEEDKNLLKDGLKNQIEIRDALDKYFNNTLKSDINKIIIRNAKSVMISTAISQNGRLDFISVIVINLKMIKEIVLKSGFRPSYPKLGKLAANVFTTAMIAEGLEGLDYRDIFPASTTNFLSEIPLIKPIASSIIQGISNALLTIRIGIVTRKYLFTEYKEATKSEIRSSSIKESIKILPQVIKDVINFLPKRIASMFKKKDKTAEDQDQDKPKEEEFTKEEPTLEDILGEY